MVLSDLAQTSAPRYPWFHREPELQVTECDTRGKSREGRGKQVGVGVGEHLIWTSAINVNVYLSGTNAFGRKSAVVSRENDKDDENN